MPDMIFGGRPIKRVMLRSESRSGLQADGLPQTQQRIVTQATKNAELKNFAVWQQDILSPVISPLRSAC
ncbi:MAG: hypothetical protein IPP84_15320 [Propionivibrio sp.]|uniref:hypothetical protein n=1 Tax=Propionivibrio sp. TaxID=2212460 RepID=UPI0025DBF87D|nr:hypothetical protein [Propionivibrio sp.]MBL0209246.1 hypothetical protein [Propionivibrio sp.]